MKRLREIAEAATPGPWSAEEYHGRSDGLPFVNHTVTAEDITVVADVRDGGQPDNEFIATFDPLTVLALLDVAEFVDTFLFGCEDPDGNLTDANLHELRDIAMRHAERLRDVIPAPSFTDCPDCGQMTVEIIDGVAALTCPICEGVTA